MINLINKILEIILIEINQTPTKYVTDSNTGKNTNNLLISHALDKNMLSHTAQIITYKNCQISITYGKHLTNTRNI
jgi:hypothetical protein